MIDLTSLHMMPSSVKVVVRSKGGWPTMKVVSFCPSASAIECRHWEYIPSKARILENDREVRDSR